MEEKINIKFGVCPYCNSSGYNREVSEYVGDYDIPYLVVDCWCDNCDKKWSEYYSQDEVKISEGEDGEFYLTNTISEDEKKTLLEAIDLLIDKEEDAIDYTDLVKKLKGELVKYG